MPAGKANEIVARQFRILELLPKAPRDITVGDLRRRLAEEGYDVCGRTVMRDLERMTLTFPLRFETRDGRRAWSLMKDCRETRDLSPADALALELARQYLGPSLPAVMRRALAPLFDRAQHVLSRRGRAWCHKVACVPVSGSERPPQVSAPVQAAAAEALLNGQMLAIECRSRPSSRLDRLVVSPHLLLQAGLATYLVVSSEVDGQEPLQAVPLHEVVKASVRPQHGRRVGETTLRGFIARRFSRPSTEAPETAGASGSSAPDAEVARACRRTGHDSFGGSSNRGGV